MTSDAKSLLTGPPPSPPDLTVDGLAAALAKLSAMGMGGAGVHLPGGLAVNAVDLVAHGEIPAHFVVRHK